MPIVSILLEINRIYVLKERKRKRERESMKFVVVC
jgi:hypothetical protein